MCVCHTIAMRLFCFWALVPLVLASTTNATATNDVAKETKIVGGNEVQPHFARSFVGAILRDGFFGCGAALLTPTAAITAAHCVFPGITYDVVFHRHNLSRPLSSEGAVLRRVQRVVQHPLFSRVHYDFALLLWSDPIDFVRPARLLFRSFVAKADFTDLYTTTIGWGTLSESGPLSDVLMAVSGLRVWSFDECRARLDITDTMVCAGGQLDRDACQVSFDFCLSFWKKVSLHGCTIIIKKRRREYNSSRNNIDRKGRCEERTRKHNISG